MGIVHSDQNLGLECAGVVSRVGPNTKDDLQVGDRVICWSPGSLATHVRANAQLCFKIPDGLSFAEAASLPTVFATAIRGLLEISDLSQGETVLIQSAAEGPGLAMIQLAKMIGAQVRSAALYSFILLIL